MAKEPLNPKLKFRLSLHECTTLRRCFDARRAQLQRAIDRAMGTLYPSVWAAEIRQIEALFLKLTGHPIGELPEEEKHAR